MAPKLLINKRTHTIWEYTPDLATNTDLEPFYGEESTPETAVADAEVGEDDGEDLVDPVTGELIVKDDKPAVTEFQAPFSAKHSGGGRYQVLDADGLVVDKGLTKEVAEGKVATLNAG